MMIGLWEGSTFVYALWALLALGLVSVAMARAMEGSPHERHVQRLFLVLLGLVGVVTIVTLALNREGWFSSGTTLSLMVVGAVCDFRRAP